MNTRLELHEVLCEALGSRNVYFQPPETIKMKYPAIRYSVNDIVDRKADDINYTKITEYQVTLIDPNPDSSVFDRLRDLPYSSFDRYYGSENLNHYVFTLYF